MFPLLKGKIAGRQVTGKMLLVCSDAGKNYPLQCLVRCWMRVVGDEKPALSSFLGQTGWKRKFCSVMGTAENAIPQVLHASFFFS